MTNINITDSNGTPIKSTTELFSALAWGSYASNRDNGMTHEQLISIGVGNEAMRERYDNETTSLTSQNK